MRKDIQDATVRLKPDAAYDSASPDVARKGTVIVPRSDDAGRQDGRIPPGIAAELGLVPKLHEVGKDMAYLSRKEAAESGKSGDELYADFYRRHAKEPPAPAPQQGGRQALTAENRLRILTDAGYTVTADGRVIPPQAGAGTRPAGPHEKAIRKTAAKAGPRKASRRVSRADAPASEEQVRQVAAIVDALVPGAGRLPPLRGKRTPVRVKTAENADDRADTLDGFYDELQGSGLGTDEVRRDAETGVWGRAAGLPEAPVPRVQERPAAPEPDPDGDAVFEMARKFARERDEARAAYDELKRDFEELKQDYLALLQREANASGISRQDAETAIADLTGQLQRTQAELFVLKKEAEERQAVRPSDTVRVQLGAEPELLRVSGHRSDGEKWDTALMGHLDFSRMRGEFVLSVLDPKYASELLAVLTPGIVRIVNGNGAGTACAYSGICDKIYGDPESADYITLFRFCVVDG